MRALSSVALIVGVILIPSALGMAKLDHDRDVSELERTLGAEADEHRGQLESYFAHASSIILLTANSPAFANVLAEPGTREEKVRRQSRAIRNATHYLDNLEQLFAGSIGEAAFIDANGEELARVVRGDISTAGDLSTEEEQAPFFAPAFALDFGQVHQSSPYVSEHTGEWVISNATLVPQADGKKRAIAHFEVSIDSFRNALGVHKESNLRVLDGRTGRVIIDAARSQRVGARLGVPDDRRFAGLTRVAGSGITDVAGRRVAYQRVHSAHGDANDWIVVAGASGPTGGIISHLGPAPIAMFAIALAILALARFLHVVDRAQRGMAEAARRESEQRNHALVEQLPLVTWCASLDDPPALLYMSPMIEAVVGHPAAAFEVDAFPLLDLVHPEDRRRVTAELLALLRDGTPMRSEHRLVAADGRPVTVLQEGTMARDATGAPLYAQGYLLDMTDRRRLEEQLRLSQKLESVGQLAAGVAHEINTPIQFVGDSVTFAQDAVADLLVLADAYQALLGEAEGADALADAAARAREAEEEADLAYLRERLPVALTRAQGGIERVAAIVRAMKDFAHPRTGEHGPVDLNATVASVIVVTQNETKYVADVETDVGELPPVHADGGEVNQVLVNLLVNAAHAIADRGPERGTIRVVTTREDEEAVITVSDTGCGMPEEVRRRIFDPFFTTKELGRGTGQGLAIVHAIVTERHGGTITVESEPDAGTTFEIRLPVGRSS